MSQFFILFLINLPNPFPIYFRFFNVLQLAGEIGVIIEIHVGGGGF